MQDDVAALIGELERVISSVLNQDLAKIDGFRRRQLEAIAKQAVLIQEGVRSGKIDAELQQFFMEGLEAMVGNFVSTLKGLLAVTAEKVHNKIVDFLTEQISRVL